MQTQKMTAPKGVNYLKDWMPELPANCVLSKGITGCGATTLGIEQAGHTLIAMPYTGLIENKTAQYPDKLLGIFGRGDKTAEIKEYLKSHDQIKIATTFDSLWKVCDVLGNHGINPYRETHLLVDEWHVLFNAYDYRYDGVRKLLDTAPRFDRATYISATPIERQYWLEELRHLPEIRLEWPDAKPTLIRSHKVDKPLEYMAGICRQRLLTSGENYHIFLNSTEDIGRIIRTAGLTTANTRVVCSQNEDSIARNLAKLPDGFTISRALDAVKTFNFYTSTCFEGQDIHDPNGRSFVVSHTDKEHTLVDISTTFIQICGRLRNSNFNNEIVHFYSTNRYLNDVSFSEFVAATNRAVADAEGFASAINAVPDTHKSRVLAQMPYFNEPYVHIVGDKVLIDRNMVNFDIVNYRVVNGLYQTKCNVINEYLKNDLVVSNDDNYTAPQQIKLLTQAKIGFRDLFDMYCAIRSSEPLRTVLPDSRLALIEGRNDLVAQAYNILGRDEVVRLKYQQTNIRREIIKRSNKGQDYKIVGLVNNAHRLQTAIPTSELKSSLQGIYDQLGLTRTAKATDLAEWYEIKQTTRTINGRSVACITLIRPKLVRVTK